MRAGAGPGWAGVGWVELDQGGPSTQHMADFMWFLQSPWNILRVLQP